MINMRLISALLTALFIGAVLGLYWLPSILGCRRRQPNLFAVVVINALLGWSVICRHVALVKALSPAVAAVSFLPQTDSLD